MPIGDLLASITGEKPKSTPVPIKTSLPLKRKVEYDDSKSHTQKAQRTASSADARSISDSRNGESAAPLPLAKAVSRPASDPARPSAGHGITRPVSSQPQRPRVVPGIGMRVNSQQSPDSPAAVARSAPKKGSFAEIMARAVKAQQSMGQVGKIQHKPLDKVSSKRDRTDAKVDGQRDPKRAARGQGRTSASGQRGGMNGGSATKNLDRNADRGRSPGTQASRAGLDGKKELNQASEVKKPKKAAVATTGYQGTARPPPGASSKGGVGSTTSAGSNPRRDADRSRRIPFGGSRSRNRRDDDYDEMDDFIDDDEDNPEPEYGTGRYRYASEEDESDMEAGLSDIDEEEREAEILGRREDREQEALEQRLKREKEERKRRFMQAAAAKRR